MPNVAATLSINVPALTGLLASTILTAPYIPTGSLSGSGAPTWDNINTYITALTANTLSARQISLIHTPPNDGTNPVFTIGEVDTTIANGFSGFRLVYNELNNTLALSSVMGSILSQAILIDRNNNVSINTSLTSSTLAVSGSFSTRPPVSVTSSYTVLPIDSSIIFNSANGPITVTLPAATTYPGRWLDVKNINSTITAVVTSASSNITPLSGGTTNANILSSAPGNSARWARIQSDGSSWVIMASN